MEVGSVFYIKLQAINNLILISYMEKQNLYYQEVSHSLKICDLVDM